MKKYFVVLSTFLFFFCSELSAQSISLGTYVPYAFKAQSNMQGSSTKVALNPFVSVGWSLPLSGRRHFALPELGLVHHTDRADDTSVRTFFVLYNLGFAWNRHFMLRYGFGTFATRISGSGETIVLNDGGGMSEFYSPSEAETTYTTTANLGGEFRFNREWSVKLDLHLLGALSSEKRKVSYMASFVYYW